MSYRRFRPVRESAPPRSSTRISWEAVLDLTAAAAGTSSRAVRGASFGNLFVNWSLVGLTRLMNGARIRTRLQILDLRVERGRKEGVSSVIHERMRSIIGPPTTILPHRSRGGMRKEADLGWNGVMVVRILVNGGKGRKKRGGAFDSLRERRGGMEANSESWGKKREESSSGGGNRPRLNLQPRTLPVNEEAKSEDASVVVKPKGSNPFGEARPREEVLKEKAQDLKDIEEKLESINVDSAGGSDGQSVPKRSVWGGRERVQAVQPKDRTDKSWRKRELVAPPQSAGETEHGQLDMLL